MDPLITVLIATYNQATYLPEALQSLEAQTLPASAFEILVINDGSTDETSEVLEGYANWVRVIERENQGLAPTCQEGLQEARGEFFARLDSDDMVHADWLQTLLDALEAHPNACCAYSDRYLLERGRRRRVDAEAKNLYTLEGCGTLFRTEAVRRVGGYRNLFWEEYDLYLRLRTEGDFVHVPRPLYFYRQHQDNMTNSLKSRRNGWIELAEVWDASVLRAVGRDADLEDALGSLNEGAQNGT